MLAKIGNVKILDIKNSDGWDALDIAVGCGHISIFSFLVVTLFETYNISNIKSVRRILSDENMNKWIEWCEIEKNTGLYSFLTLLNESGLKEEKFGKILSYLSNASNEMSGNIGLLELEENYNIIRKDDFIANYLFNNLKKESLIDLFNVIMKGMNDYELSFNDSLLFLCKLINNNEFNKNIKNITQKCLNYQTKTQEKVLFFKNYLVKSNIWCKNVNDKDFEEKEEKNKNNNNKNTLFDSIHSKVLSKELNIHKEYLKNKLIELENKFNKQFKQIKNNIKEFSLADSEGISQIKIN